MLNDLIIGSTSQIARFWPQKNVEIISSRDIDLSYIQSKKWNRVYIAFAEGRTFLNDPNLFYDTNVTYTYNIIENVKDFCENIVFYSTAELWNRTNGSLNLSDDMNYLSWQAGNSVSNYIHSKNVITTKLLNSNFTEKLIILFPFTFNSGYRKEKQFLMPKIFDSIINNTKVVVGDLGHYREMLHPKFVVKQSIKAKENQLIGSGRMIFVRDFIKDLYEAFNMKFEDFVEEKQNTMFPAKSGMYYLKSEKCLYPYQQLLNDTIIDLAKIKYEGDK